MKMRRGTLLPGFEPAPTPRGPNGHPEADFQKALVRDLRRVLPRDVIVHGSNHEVRGNGPEAAKQQAIVKAMGAYTGHSDVVVYAPGPRVLFLELKVAYGPLSEEQKAFRDRVLAMGCAWAKVRTITEALDALAAAGIRTRIVEGRP